MAVFATGSSADVTYVVEGQGGVNFGTTPATPAMNFLPINSTTLGLTKESLQSARLRADRMIEHVRHGNKSVGGDIAYELSFGDFDDMLSGALMGNWTADVLEPGLAIKTFTFERRHLDVGQYFRYRGCAINTWSVSVQPNQIVNGTFGVLGRDMERAATTLGVPADVSSNEPYDSFTGVIMEGGGAVADITGLEMTLDNGIAQQFVLFSDLARQLTSGRSNLTGTITVPLSADTTDLIDKFINEEESSISFTLGTGPGSMTFFLPRVKYMGADNPVSDENVISVSMPFQALYSADEGTNLRVTRVPLV